MAALVRDIEQYTGVDDAMDKVKGKLRPQLGTETIPTSESYGRASAVDLFSPAAVPPFDVSHMDGFAVRSDDVRDANETAPVALKISGQAKLGSGARLTVRQGEAVRVATGSRLPSGADAVVPAELAKLEGGRVIVTAGQESGRWVYKSGADVRKGEQVLKKGQVIKAQQVGLLLGLGLTGVKVRDKPKVAVIATGSELTDASTPKPGKIRNSHSPYFISLIKALGAIPVDMGIARDELGEVARTIRKALSRSDVVLTLGGTSVGRADLVGEAISSLGPDLMLHGLRLDRGRVTGIAVVGGKPVLMMPGPIQGAMNAFALFGVQIIDLLAGKDGKRLEVPCSMGTKWEARKRFPNFTKVVYVRLRSGQWMVAEPLAGETESIRVLSDADGYIVIPESVTRIEEGSVVGVRLLPGFSFA